MTSHALITDGPLVQRLARTLAHTVWQAAAAAALLRLVLAVVRERPGVRYGLACAAIVTTAMAAVVTFSVLTNTGQQSGPATGPVPAASLTPAVVNGPRATGQRVAVRATPFVAWVVLAWVAGVVLQGGWQAIGWTRVRRLAREPAVADGRWTAGLAAAADRLGVHRAVRLLASARVDVPVVLGVLRPAVVVPLAVLSDLPAEHILAVLAHELAHVRRHDYLVNLVQCDVEAVFFYHPAVWWMSAVVRREREHCCDDAAAEAVGSRPAVAAALVSLEDGRGPRLAMAATGGSLGTRVRRLVGPPSPRRGTAGPAVAVLTIALAAVLFAGWDRPTARAETRPADGGLLRPGDLVTVEVRGLFSAAVTTWDAHVGREGLLPVPLIGRVNLTGQTAATAGRVIDDRFGTAHILTRGGTVVRLKHPVDGAGWGPLAAGDRVVLRFWDVEGPGKQTVVEGRLAADGTIDCPLLGRAKLAGLTEAEAMWDLAAGYEKANLVANLAVDVVRLDPDPGADAGRVQTMTADRIEFLADPTPLQSRATTRPGTVAGRYTGEVYVGGQVSRTGVYAIHDGQRTSLSQIVIAAGDVNEEAGVGGWVTLIRRDGGRQTTPVKDVRFAALLDGTVTDPDLQAGDIVRVSTVPPPAERPATGMFAAPAPAPATRPGLIGEAYVGGQCVARPGVYSLGGRPVTLRQMILMAGLDEAGRDKPRWATVYRRDGRQTTLGPFPVSLVLDGMSVPDVRPNDVVQVTPQMPSTQPAEH